METHKKATKSSKLAQNPEAPKQLKIRILYVFLYGKVRPLFGKVRPLYGYTLGRVQNTYTLRIQHVISTYYFVRVVSS